MTMKARDRWLTGVSLALLAGWMSLKGHHRGGVIVGFVLTAAATLGVLGLLGDSPLDPRGDERPVLDGRRWWQREDVVVAVFGALLYIPLAGAFGLWDPWETHYSEVAREILSRDDWITTWWAQEGWFMSKPVLVFWMSALGMGVGSLFGLRYQSDAGPNIQEWFIRGPIVLLTIAAMVALARAVSRSWGPRAGMLVAMVLGTMPQWFFLSHQAMTDMPFVAPLVLAVAMLMLAVTDGPEALVEARSFTILGRTFRVSLWHLTVGLIVMIALPQITYLLTRRVMFGCPEDANLNQCNNMLEANRLFGRIQMPVETFYSGSAGNSGVNDGASVPGSPKWERIASAAAFLPSVFQGIVWTIVLLSVLGALRRDRRAQTLHYALFYLWCGISTLGKGPGGVAIPGAIALLHFVSSGRWRELLRIRLGLGIAVFCVVGMPWYVAIYGRLGNEFIDRFVRHDLINRMTIGVHGDTGSLRYFLWQLGYAMFPWSGLVPVALFGWRYIVPPEATKEQRDIARMGFLWFMLAFALFSAMTTKFHHYIFPAVPGAAVMVGLLVHRLMGASHEVTTDGLFERLRPQIAQAGALVLAVVGGASFLGGVRGQTALNATRTNAPALGVAMLVAAAAAWWFGWRIHTSQTAQSAPVEAPPTDQVEANNYRENKLSAETPEAPEAPETAMISSGVAALTLGGAAILALVVRDFVVARSTPPGSERLIHLFVYNYERAWPSTVLDFRGALLGFGVAGVASVLLVGVPKLRPYAARGMVVAASLFALWGLDVYMMQITPHWTQRPLFERYYARRGQATNDPRFPFDPIVAHQMNWKGENFYTGNHVVAEECGLKYCTGSTAEFLRLYGAGRVFFVTEHSRLQGLLGTIRTAGGEGHALTTERDNNKFVLVDATMSPRGASTPGNPQWAPTQGPTH